MKFWLSVMFVAFLVSGWGIAQDAQQGPDANPSSAQSDQQKSRDRSAETGESSSKDTRIDLSPPKDDAKNHVKGKPGLGNPSSNPEDMTDMTGVSETHPWNPYRAMKDDEVGDYYLKQGNLKGALARYQDALVYKDNDAIANFRIAQCYEKLHQPNDAVPYYQAYLKILPEGPYAKQARKALQKLGAENFSSQKVSAK